MRRHLSLLVLSLGLLALAGCESEIPETIGPISTEIPPAAILESDLSWMNQVPRCAEASPLGQGDAVVLLSLDEQTITVDHLRFGTLSSPATAAHIGVGAPGEPGTLVFLVAIDPESPVISVDLTEADYPSPPPAGAPATFHDVVVALVTGNTFITVDTEKCPDGEIRGQLGPATVAF